MPASGQTPRACPLHPLLLYLSYITRVLCPMSDIAIRSGTPARFKGCVPPFTRPGTQHVGTVLDTIRNSAGAGLHRLLALQVGLPRGCRPAAIMVLLQPAPPPHPCRGGGPPPMVAQAFLPERPPRVRPGRVKAWRTLLPRRGCQRVDGLPQLVPSARRWRGAVRRGQARHQGPEKRANAVDPARLRACQACQSWRLLCSELAGLRQEAPPQGPSLLGPCSAGLLLRGCAACLALAALRAKRWLAGAPALFARLAMVCLHAASRRNRCEGCRATVRVI